MKIYRARIIVTMDGPPIENGAVVIAGNRIADVGSFEEVSAHHRGEVIDLGEQVLLPGLINAHCHLDYTVLRHSIPRPRSFAAWIQQINALKSQLSDEENLESIERGFAEAQKWGTTTIANIEAFPELLPRMGRPPPLRTWWFYEMIDVRSRIPTEEFVTGALSFFEARSDWLGGFGLSPHSPYTASPDLFRLAADCARASSMLLTTHLAESREEMQMFRDGAGPLFDFLKTLGRTTDGNRDTPLAFLLRQTPLNENWLIVHLNELEESDFALLAANNRFHVVHCPRSHAYFGHTPFALERLRALGFNICLGTDSLASNSTLSLFSEMRSVQRTFPSLSPREILELVTVNPARALHQAGNLGQIKKDALADLIALPCATASAAIFDAIVAHEEPIRWVMIDGAVVIS